MTASIGLAQLERLNQMNKRRSEIIAKYLEGLSEIDLVSPLLPYAPEKYVYQMFCIKSEHKEDLIIYLKSKGIATGCHYTPLTMQPLFGPFRSDCTVAEVMYNKMITLPLHSDLTDYEVEFIVDSIARFT